jgi:hypothetical protein
VGSRNRSLNSRFISHPGILLLGRFAIFELILSTPRSAALSLLLHQAAQGVPVTVI